MALTFTWAWAWAWVCEKASEKFALVFDNGRSKQKNDDCDDGQNHKVPRKKGLYRKRQLQTIASADDCENFNPDVNEKVYKGI